MLAMIARPDSPPAVRRPAIPTDDLTLIGLGLAAIFVLWLVFAMIRKLFGLVLIGALVLGGWVVWNDPELLERLTDTIARFLGQM